MLYFKACPRCQIGTVEFSSDTHGPYLGCLTCGHQISGYSLQKLLSEAASTEHNQTAAAPERRSSVRDSDTDERVKASA